MTEQYAARYSKILSYAAIHSNIWHDAAMQQHAATYSKRVTIHNEYGSAQPIQKHAALWNIMHQFTSICSNIQRYAAITTIPTYIAI